MVDLQPLSTPNNSNSSEQSSSPSLSPTSPLPPNLPIFVPHHLLYPPPPSTSFTPFHFQEPMFFSPFFYYYYYPEYPPPFYLYSSSINYTLPSFPSPPPPPCYGGSQPVAMENSVVANTGDGVIFLEPPAPSGRRAVNRKRYMQRNKRRWVKKEWKQKVQKAEHLSPPSQPLPPPPLISGHLAKCTTLMVKNIPNSISRRTMINMLDRHCRKQNHKAAYNFFYLPFDFEHKQNLGYAFVNFTTEEGASSLSICWNGKGWSDSAKIRKICPAKVQGFEMCKKHFKDTCFHCSSEDFLPVEFSPPRNGFNGGASKMSTIGVWLSRLNTVNPPRLIRH